MGDLKSGESLFATPSRPQNNNDQTTPSHKSTQFPNTIITWVWHKTLYEVLHAVKITTFTLMNEEIIFVSKMRVQKMPQRLYYESKKSCNFWKKWSLYYSKLSTEKFKSLFYPGDLMTCMDT